MRSYNPLRILSSRTGPYEKLPDHDVSNGSAAYNNQRGRFGFASGATQRLRSTKLSFRLGLAAITAIVLLFFLGGSLFGGGEEESQIPEDETSAEEHANTRYWEVFPR